MDPSFKYDFRPATIEDYDKVLDLALNGFIPNEPHAMGLGVTSAQSSSLVDWLVKKCLAEPFSMVDFSPFDLDVDAFPENVLMLCNLLDLKKKIWTLEPDANKILRQEISFVDPAHQRRGIATHLLHLALDFEKLKEDGFHGIQAEATSFANQNLLRKSGYSILARTSPEEYVRSDGSVVILPDETTEMQLVFLKLNRCEFPICARYY